MKKWTMIINPASASSTTEGKWQEYLKMLTDAGLEVEYLVTERPGHATALARSAAADGKRQFIAVGGDGTIHEVMTGLLRYCDAEGAGMDDFTLAVLPYGTGNDWIKTSLVPADIPEAVNCILKGNKAKEDVVRLRFKDGVYCMANIGGIGLDADICYNTNTLKSKGHRGGFLYKLVAPYSIFTAKRRGVRVECDGEMVYEGKLYSAVIANGIYRGGGIKQNAEGVDWADGKLEVSIMPGMNRIQGMQVMMHALAGDFAVQPGIISRQFRKMTVTPLGASLRVESDGELPGDLPLTVELTGQQINIIVP